VVTSLVLIGYLLIWGGLLATAHPVDLHLLRRLVTTPFYRQSFGRFLGLQSWTGPLLFCPAVFLLAVSWPWSSLIAHWRSLDARTLRTILKHPLSIGGITLYAALTSKPKLLESKSKLTGHALFQAHDVWKPRLYAVVEDGQVSWRSPVAGPAIAKPEFGRQGRGVTLVNTRTPGWEAALGRRERWIVEEHVSSAEVNRARHYRIVTFLRGLNAEVLDVLRYTQPDPGVPASNLARGGRRERLEDLPDERPPKHLSRAIDEARRMHSEGLPDAFVVAWDIILAARGPCFLELNLAPTCRGDSRALHNVDVLVSELELRLRNAHLFHHRSP
jgi:hypothetical protein